MKEYKWTISVTSRTLLIAGGILLSALSFWGGAMTWKWRYWHVENGGAGDLAFMIGYSFGTRWMSERYKVPYSVKEANDYARKIWEDARQRVHDKEVIAK